MAVGMTEHMKVTAQPYFVLDTENFRQEIYLKQGISHFFAFENSKNRKLRVVPDGCTDIFFIYAEGTMECLVCGTTLEYTEDYLTLSKDVFGVRFMPGVQPAILSAGMSSLVNSKVEFEKIASGNTAWLDEMAAEKNFSRRMEIFLKAYNEAEEKKEKPFGKAQIVQTIKNYVYDTAGRIRVGEIAELTGYTERYISKIFIEEMGYSPKTFCMIIQFQRSLKFLNDGNYDKMTEAAVELGYYDQSQFIRSFKHFAGTTPKKYLDMVKSTDRVRNSIGSDLYNP